MNEVNFDEIYQRICDEQGEKLNKIRRSMVCKCIILIIAIIALVIINIKLRQNTVIVDDNNPLFIVSGAILLFLIIWICIIQAERIRYNKEYKEKLINSLIGYVNKDYRYTPKSGLTSSEYKKSGFDLDYDKFTSEDKIDGLIGRGVFMKMSQVKTEKVVTVEDSDGHGSTRKITTTFLGIYGIINLPYYVKELKITKNSNFSKFDSDRVEMESAEFEKYFDVFAQDRQKAMEIITAETIEEMVKLKNRYKKCNKFDISLKGKNIYFRMDIGDIFEPQSFKNAVDYKMLLKYFEIINLPKEIYQSLKGNLEIAN